jgi:hypothetical protein
MFSKGKVEKWKKILPPLPLHPKHGKNKIKALRMHVKPSHWLYESSIFQNYSSPFLA